MENVEAIKSRAIRVRSAADELTNLHSAATAEAITHFAEDFRRESQQLLEVLQKYLGNEWIQKIKSSKTR